MTKPVNNKMASGDSARSGNLQFVGRYLYNFSIHFGEKRGPQTHHRSLPSKFKTADVFTLCTKASEHVSYKSK